MNFLDILVSSDIIYQENGLIRQRIRVDLGLRLSDSAWRAESTHRYLVYWTSLIQTQSLRRHGRVARGGENTGRERRERGEGENTGEKDEKGRTQDKREEKEEGVCLLQISLKVQSV